MKPKICIAILLSWIAVGSAVYFCCSREEKLKENQLHTISLMMSESNAHMQHIAKWAPLMRKYKEGTIANEDRSKGIETLVWSTLLCIRHSNTIENPAYDELLAQYPIEVTVRSNLENFASQAVLQISDLINPNRKPNGCSDKDWQKLLELIDKVKETQT